MPSVRRFAVVLMGTACGAGPAPNGGRTAGVHGRTGERGQEGIQAHCATCHAGDLRGKDDAPALKGDAFLATWQAKPVKELFDFVRTTMPPEGGSISADDYLAIVAYALQENGATVGTQPLTPTTSTLISAVLSRPKPQFARD